MPITTKEELQERAQLIRIHEANCSIDHPSVDEANFRVAIMKKILKREGPVTRDGREIALPYPKDGQPVNLIAR